jgi:hypothetical protein
MHSTITGGQNIGVSFEEALNLLLSTGICSLNDKKYSPNECFTIPTSIQFTSAQNNKIKSWQGVKYEEIQYYISSGYPVLIAVCVYNGVGALHNLVRESGKLRWTNNSGAYQGNHAMCIVGYDDVSRIFKIQNSWGVPFGTDGYVYANYNILQDAVYELYTAVDIDAAVTLSVSPSVFHAPSTAGNHTFTITSNSSWTVSSNQSWCTVSPTSGSGNRTITATVTANTGTSSRTATLTVTSGMLTKPVSIQQDGVALNVSPSVINPPSTAGNHTFTITSSSSWTVSSNQSWCTVSPTSGSGDRTITATVTGNTGTSSRTATLTVTSGTQTKQVTIQQEGVIPTPTVSSFTTNSSSYNIGSTVYFSGSGSNFSSWKIVWLKGSTEEAVTSIQNNTSISYSATVNSTAYTGARLYLYSQSSGSGTSTTRDVSFNVLAPSINSFYTNSSSYSIGSTVNFSGSGSNFASWKIVWLKGSTEEAVTSIQNNTSISYSATVNSTAYTGARLYLYSQSSGSGTSTTRDVSFQVYPPSVSNFTVTPSSINIGNTINFSGSGSNYASWKIVWLKGSTEEAATSIQNNTNISYSGAVYSTLYTGARLYLYSQSNGSGSAVSTDRGFTVTSPISISTRLNNVPTTTFNCGQWVDIFVSGYTGFDWRTNLEVEYYALTGQPQYTILDESYVSGTRYFANDRIEGTPSNPSFTFSPTTPSYWSGRWVKIVARIKSSGQKSIPIYIWIR